MAVSSETVAQLLGAERNPLVRRLREPGRVVRLPSGTAPRACSA